MHPCCVSALRQTDNPEFSFTSIALLTALCGNLLRCTLSTLLALDAGGLTASGASCALGLLHLLLALSGSLLLLALLDGGLAGGGTGLWALRPAFLDHIERGTDDGTLVLNGAASALLGDLLQVAFPISICFLLLHIPSFAAVFFFPKDSVDVIVN